MDQKLDEIDQRLQRAERRLRDAERGLGSARTHLLVWDFLQTRLRVEIAEFERYLDSFSLDKK